MRSDYSQSLCRRLESRFCKRWGSTRPLALGDLSSLWPLPSRIRRRFAISKLPAALCPYRKNWPVLILIPQMPLVYLKNTTKWDPARCRAKGPAGENSGFMSHNFLIKTPVWPGKTRGKRKEWCLVQVGLFMERLQWIRNYCTSQKLFFTEDLTPLGTQNKEK